ncbi:Uncharacterised protein at_DN0510 [Pycnogonum litorale]
MDELLLKWTLAVWQEEDVEEEAVIPTTWIEGDFVRWPRGVNTLRAMKEMRNPDSKWDSFKLIKVKLRSGMYALNFSSFIYRYGFMDLYGFRLFMPIYVYINMQTTNTIVRNTIKPQRLRSVDLKMKR